MTAVSDLIWRLITIQCLVDHWWHPIQKPLVCLEMLSWSHLCWPYLLYVPVDARPWGKGKARRFRHLAWSPMVPVVICSKLKGSNHAILWVHSYLYYWLVGWNMLYFSIYIYIYTVYIYIYTLRRILLFHIYWEEYSQLTNNDWYSYFSEWLKPPTRDYTIIT